MRTSLPLLGARALGQRSFERAARLFEWTKNSSDRSAFLHAYSLAMAGHRGRAAIAVRNRGRSHHPIQTEPAPWAWLVETFGPAGEDNVGLRNAAVEALAGYGSASVDALSVALPALDADGRKLAAEALGRTGQTAALLLLGSMANDPDPNVRAAVVEAVAGVGIMACGLVLSVWGGFRRRIYTTMLGTVILGLSFLVLGFTPGGLFWMALASVLVLGLTIPLIDGPIMAIL